jgi:MATE family multidrug resistance protein
LYVYAYIPGLIILGLIDGQRRFLNMMGKNYVPLICQSCSVLLHIGLCYWFVYVCKLNIRGIGYASTITNCITYTLLCTYSYCLEDIREAVTLPTQEVFQDLGVYLKLGIPSCLMTCLEWWAFEVMYIMVGLIGVHEQAGNVIVI